MMIIVSTVSYSAFAQTYQIQGFSEDYNAVIKTVENKDSESNSVINIIDTKTKKTLISQPSNIDIEYELDNSQENQLGKKISANIVSIPYGAHSVLIYDDFNFDNKKDLALRDGRNGCYGGPSYQVYLKDSNTFTYSEEFTELAQGYCGFFGVNKTSKTLSTMTKSGAAWHQYSEYKVIDNKPVAIHIIEEEYNSRGLIAITERKRIGGKMIVQQYDQLIKNDEAEGNTRYIYTFDFDNGKKMVLDSYGDHLYYAFADKDDKIELYYDGLFVYDTQQKTLSFTNRPVVYQINSQGITVKLPNQTVLLKPKYNSQYGSLDEVTQFKNVSVK
jgi:hypothetical protein